MEKEKKQEGKEIEATKKEEVIAPPVSRISIQPDGKFVTITLSLHDVHAAVGVLHDVILDLLEMVRIPRMRKRMEDAQRREALRGGTGVIKGIKQDKGFSKKLLK